MIIAGCSMNRTKIGITLLILAIVAIGPPAYRLIRNDKLNQAARAGDSGRVTELLNEGVSVNGRGMHGMTPIMSAAEGGHLEVVKLLVTKGADVNGHNSSGSALMWAVDSGNEEVVRCLLQNGADVRWESELGDSALSFAREKKRTNIVRILEEAASPHAMPGP